MRRDMMRRALAQESRAYGFTLAFWGAGALLIGEFGVPNFTEVMLYVTGALIGFGAVSILAYRDAFGTVSTGGENEEYLVLSMVHFFASIAPVAITGFFLLNLEPVYAFAISGFIVTSVYNLSMPLEDKIYRKAKKLEERFINF